MPILPVCCNTQKNIVTASLSSWFDRKEGERKEWVEETSQQRTHINEHTTLGLSTHSIVMLQSGPITERVKLKTETSLHPWQKKQERESKSQGEKTPGNSRLEEVKRKEHKQLIDHERRSFSCVRFCAIRKLLLNFDLIVNYELVVAPATHGI